MGLRYRELSPLMAASFRLANDNYIPIGSMYGIYANIWGILMVNVTIYTIHGSYGIGNMDEYGNYPTMAASFRMNYYNLPGLVMTKVEIFQRSMIRSIITFWEESIGDGQKMCFSENRVSILP
jgi:hypothetical protein